MKTELWFNNYKGGADSLPYNYLHLAGQCGADDGDYRQNFKDVHSFLILVSIDIYEKHVKYYTEVRFFRSVFANP